MVTQDLNLEKIIQDAIVRDPNFPEILEIVKSNTRGKIWAVGGFIFRNLAAALYGTPAAAKDYDFLVEKLLKVGRLGPGWHITSNTFGGPKIQKDDLNIDIVPLNKLFVVIRQGLKPTIDTFLNSTSLTIQSIAYDLDQNKLVGDVGINALLTKTVDINNEELLSFYLSKKKITLEQYIKDKVTDLGFLLAK